MRWIIVFFLFGSASVFGMQEQNKKGILFRVGSLLNNIEEIKTSAKHRKLITKELDNLFAETFSPTSQDELYMSGDEEAYSTASSNDWFLDESFVKIKRCKKQKIKNNNCIEFIKIFTCGLWL